MENPASSAQNPLVSEQAVVGSGASDGGSSRMLRLSWRNPLLLVVVLLVAALGVYLILASSADSVAANKVWSTAADWNTGTLNNTVVSGNSVVLSSKTTTSSSTVTLPATNLALNKTVYAQSTASGVKTSYLDDGNTATSWTSNTQSSQWIYIDLGRSDSIGTINLTWANSNAKAYLIQVSNNATSWTNVYNTSKGDGGVNNLTGLKISDRYVKVFVSRIANHSNVSIAELAVYGPSTTTTAPTSTTTYASSGTITLNYDASNSVTWTSLTGSTTIPANTSVAYEVRTSSDDSTWSSWVSLPSSGSLSGVAASRYIQIQATLATTNTSVTPSLTQLVLDYSVPVASPTATLSASSTQLTAGQSTTLSWTSTNATSCSASGSWSGTEAISGSVTVSPTATSTYSLSCTGSNSTASASPVTITVTPPATTTTTGSGSTDGCTNNGTVAPCIGSATTGASGWGTPVFDDEFNGTSLDTTKWNVGWFGSGITGPVNGEEVDCYDPNQVSVGNGELDLTMIQKTETCNGGSHAYATGLVNTDGKFSYTYGFAEARVWVPGSGTIEDWPAFWQDGQSWPTDGELDTMEGLSGQACGHWIGPPSANSVGMSVNGTTESSTYGCSTNNYTGGWVTFAVDWQPNLITYYYNGQNVGTVSSTYASANDNDLVDQPQFLILDLAAGYNGGAAVPAVYRIDYVRVWQQQ